MCPIYTPSRHVYFSISSNEILGILVGLAINWWTNLDRMYLCGLCIPLYIPYLHIPFMNMVCVRRDSSPWDSFIPAAHLAGCNWSVVDWGRLFLSVIYVASNSERWGNASPQPEKQKQACLLIAMKTVHSPNSVFLSCYNQAHCVYRHIPGSIMSRCGLGGWGLLWPKQIWQYSSCFLSCEQ